MIVRQASFGQLTITSKMGKLPNIIRTADYFSQKLGINYQREVVTNNHPPPVPDITPRLWCILQMITVYCSYHCGLSPHITIYYRG